MNSTAANGRSPIPMTRAGRGGVRGRYSACPFCKGQVYDDAEWCPHCRNYLFYDDGTLARSRGGCSVASRFACSWCCTGLSIECGARSITLTTDFGTASPYVAALKGALLAVNADAQLIDLSHGLPPQDLRACSFFLRASVPYFPTGTLHVVVVDPGVGTGRAFLCVDLAASGCWCPTTAAGRNCARSFPGAPAVVTLTERRYWRSEVSSTFHGRDIFAPVAGHLSLGVLPHQLGPSTSSWVELALPVPRLAPSLLEGEVLFVDDFGNLLTNLPGDVYLKARDRILEIRVGPHSVTRQVRTYSEAAPGEVVVLVSSAGTVEVAEVQGNAARRLGAGRHTRERQASIVPSRLIHTKAQHSPLAQGGALMKLTLASRYALHAVVHMAGLKKNDPVASHLIAEVHGISDRFLLKVLKPLVSAQILISVKGPNGGYRLARRRAASPCWRSWKPSKARSAARHRPAWAKKRAPWPNAWTRFATRPPNRAANTSAKSRSPRC